VALSSEAIKNPEVFDVYRSLLKYAEVVPGAIMTKLLDSVISGCQTELELANRDGENSDPQSYADHRTALEMYAFLLQWFVSAAEKVKGPAEDEEPQPTQRARRGRGGKAAAGSRSNARTAHKKSDDEWTWENLMPALLALSCRLLALKTQRIWTTSAEREHFISYV
jgi:condensin complex subunit 1